MLLLNKNKDNHRNKLANESVSIKFIVQVDNFLRLLNVTNK